jgi:hypothetical protein
MAWPTYEQVVAARDVLFTAAEWDTGKRLADAFSPKTPLGTWGLRLRAPSGGCAIAVVAAQSAVTRGLALRLFDHRSPQNVLLSLGLTLSQVRALRAYDSAGGELHPDNKKQKRMYAAALATAPAEKPRAPTKRQRGLAMEQLVAAALPVDDEPLVI